MRYTVPFAFALFACGDTNAKLPDAPADGDAAAVADAAVDATPDATADAAPDAALPAPISLTVNHVVDPTATVIVQFRDATGAIVLDQTVTPGATIMQRVAGLATVTVITRRLAGTVTRANALSWVGVGAGEQLQTDWNAVGASSPRMFTMPTLAVGGWQLALDCSPTPTASLMSAFSVRVPNTCTTGTVFAAAGTPRTDDGTVYKTNVNLAGPVNLAAEPITPIASRDITLNNIWPGTYSALVGKYDGKRSYFARRAGFAVPPPADTMVTIAAPTPNIASLATLEVRVNVTGIDDETVVNTLANDAQGGATIDLAAVRGTRLATPPMFDQTSNKITWTEQTFLAPDVTVASLRAQRTDYLFQHEVIAPYTAGEVVIPPMSGTQADLATMATDILSTLVSLERSSNLDAAGMRAKAFSSWPSVRFLAAPGDVYFTASASSSTDAL